MGKIKRFFLAALMLTAWVSLGSWGFYAHKLINHTAVLSLPVGLAAFFKEHIAYLSEHAIDPDKRCYIDTLESPRHYIDLEDLLEDGRLDTVPIHWTKAVAKYSERKLMAVGIIPWQIEISYRRLRQAMFDLDAKRILRHAADLGHYVADAHVPLHTSRNYNGQFTNQRGIHAFWETRLPERFAGEYDLWVGQADYISDVLELAWAVVRESHALVDSVLSLERQLSEQFRADRKFAYVRRNQVLHRTYSEAYATAYHRVLNGMVERRMRASIRQTANLWYSAWIDAGQPNLRSLSLALSDRSPDTVPVSESEKIIGREEWH